MKKLISVILIVTMSVLYISLDVNANETSSNSEGSIYGLSYEVYEPNLPIPDETESHTTLTSYDPRITNSKTSVKNQSGNGVCWAFASVALMESATYENTGLKVDYS